MVAATSPDMSWLTSKAYNLDERFDEEVGFSFKKVAAGMAKKQGVSTKQADSELAASTRRAGKKARKKNPNLNKVKGGNK